MIPSASETQPPPARSRNDRLIALFLLGGVFFSPLLLRVFGNATTVFGCPVLFVYVFAAWAVLVLLTALALERRTDEKNQQDRGQLLP
ncbi:MAG: hypothetical protein WCK65_16220 [Rhodospirillaceae bacterium]